MVHDIMLTSDVPVKQHPYRLNLEKQQALDKEINYMLDNDIIERVPGHHCVFWSRNLINLFESAPIFVN